MFISFRYFTSLFAVLSDNGILGDPTRITNCDEKGLRLNFTAPKTYHKKGKKHVFQVSTGDKTQITVLECGNAAGVMCPPAVLFQGKKVNQKLCNSKPSPDWGIFFSESGWMNGEVFELWFEEIYIPWVNQLRGSPADKVLLLLDGHKSHETNKMLDMAKDNNIIVYCMSANMTHILQPLDVAFFKSLQSHWDTIVHKMATEASNKPRSYEAKKVSKDNFCDTFHRARMLAICGPAQDDEHADGASGSQGPSGSQQSSQSSQRCGGIQICRSMQNGFRYVNTALVHVI